MIGWLGLVSLLACREGPEPATGPADDPGPEITGETGTDVHTGTADTATDDSSSPVDSRWIDSAVDSADTGASVPPYFGPSLLSETELYSDLSADALAPGVLLVVPQYPLWTDGAEKRRWVWIPPGESIDTTDPDDWIWPVGSVAFKEFVRNGVRVETRRFAKLAPGQWDYASYQWRADGTDADVVLDLVVDANGTEHDIPSRVQCYFCHVGPEDLFLGMSALQLDLAQQAALPLTAVVAAEVPGEGVEQEVLGYLHGNCGHCHREGTLPADRSELLLDLRVADVDPAQVNARGAIGKVAKHVVAGTDVVVVPGDPEGSQLWVRMGLVGLTRMPPSGTEIPDDAAIEIVGQWIEGLP